MIRLIIVNIIALILIGAAIYMAINEIPDWGWFLFSGVVTIGGEYIPSSKKNNKS